MVRVNIVDPRILADQHLIAEYLEIMMLVGSMRNKLPDFAKIPNDYVLGVGHINFFKNKLKYLEKRHVSIKKEMLKRKFKVRKSLDISEFGKELKKDWKPSEKDFVIIKKRLIDRINLKPSWYRYYGEKKSKSFWKNLIR